MRAGKPAAAPAQPGGAWRGVRLRRLTWVLSLLCVYSASAAASSSAAGPPRNVRPAQALAAILYRHAAYRRPSTQAPVVAVVRSTTPLTGEQTTLPVLATSSGGGPRWLKVMLPGRPNGLTGWITRSGTAELVTGWHIVVNLTARRLGAYLHGRLARTFRAVVGKPSTPTPTGEFFVQETVAMPATAAGGPFALALSARSDVLQEFEGGPGQIGIHGRDLLGGTLGQAQSHGCIRLATAAITWLASRIGPGVPVTIFR
jgi:lipoprotein-anchoring transpeptidase ErfK/SrfK